jgi:hypothetical protein
MKADRQPLKGSDLAGGCVPYGAELSDVGLHTIFLPRPAATSEPEALTIRLANSQGQRNRANMLLNRMYSRRGYGSDHTLPETANCITFTASAEDRLVGTLTLTVDSDAGLASERTFPAEIEEFRRAPGAKLCELTKFAFDSSAPSRPRLAALFHIIFIYGSHHFNCTDLFIEVNPRHRRFYSTMLGFVAVGDLKMNEAVGAPSQLMWLNVAEIRRQISLHACRQEGASRSLYPHFFSEKEETGIYARLVERTSPSAVVQCAGLTSNPYRPQAAEIYLDE